MKNRPKPQDTMLYPGVMLRGGEMILLQPTRKKTVRKTERQPQSEISARSVDKPVDMRWSWREKE